jgi:hypothetical protein
VEIEGGEYMKREKSGEGNDNSNTRRNKKKKYVGEQTIISNGIEVTTTVSPFRNLHLDEDVRGLYTFRCPKSHS